MLSVNQTPGRARKERFILLNCYLSFIRMHWEKHTHTHPSLTLTIDNCHPVSPVNLFSLYSSSSCRILSISVSCHLLIFLSGAVSESGRRSGEREIEREGCIVFLLFRKKKLNNTSKNNRETVFISVCTRQDTVCWYRLKNTCVWLTFTKASYILQYWIFLSLYHAVRYRVCMSALCGFPHTSHEVSRSYETD